MLRSYTHKFVRSKVMFTNRMISWQVPLVLEPQFIQLGLTDPPEGRRRSDGPYATSIGLHRHNLAGVAVRTGKLAIAGTRPY